jgi:hypothetical protein
MPSKQQRMHAFCMGVSLSTTARLLRFTDG